MPEVVEAFVGGEFIQNSTAEVPEFVDSPFGSVAASMINLAELFRSTRRYVEAKPLYEKAIEIRTASLGPDHPNTKSARENYERFIEELSSGD